MRSGSDEPERASASSLATCSAEAYELGDVVALGGFARCAIFRARRIDRARDARVASRARASSADPPIPPPAPPPAAPAPARSVRACRRRGDAPRDDDPLVCKAVPLAWPPGAEFLDGAPLPPRASRVRAEVDALRALDAASGASPAARLFVSLADVFVSNDVAHLVLTRGGGGARGAHRGLLPPLTLAALIARGGRGRRVGLPESQARHYAAEMALAIDHMHRHARFAHGDVKPENVLVDEPGTGHAALCDFDLAVPVDEKTTRAFSSATRAPNAEAPTNAPPRANASSSARRNTSPRKPSRGTRARPPRTGGRSRSRCTR